MKQKSKKAGILSIMLWLCLWTVLSFVLQNPIFFPDPVDVLREFWHMLGQAEFYQSTAMTWIRVMAGFLGASLSAALCAWLSYRHNAIAVLLAPPVQLLKTVPVASIVVLLLIWFGSGRLTFIITFMVVFPILYFNLLTALRQLDKELLEVGKIFQMRPLDKLSYLLLPALEPALMSSMQVTIGMSFKSGVAAEVIGQPLHSMGEQLYLDKIYLNTAGVFAWTIVMVGLAGLTEKVLLHLLHSMCRGKEILYEGNLQKSSGKLEQSECRLELRDVGKAFGAHTVFEGISLVLKPGQIYYLNGESGAGKTTMLRIIAGLEKPSSGSLHWYDAKGNEIAAAPQISMQFQEDRLMPGFHAWTNLVTALRHSGFEEEELRQGFIYLLGDQWARQPVEKFSGGMRRKVAFLRAIGSKAPVLLLDEPFTGMDEESRRKAMKLLEEQKKHRIILLATHHMEEMQSLGGEQFPAPLGGRKE